MDVVVSTSNLHVCAVEDLLMKNISAEMSPAAC